MSSSTAKLKVAINKSKKTFGIEQVKPAIVKLILKILEF